MKDISIAPVSYYGSPIKPKVDSMSIEDKEDETVVKVFSGQVAVAKIYSKSGQIIKEEHVPEQIKVKTFHPQGNLATVTFSASRTINTGNYESLKLSVGVSLPCYLEEIDEALLTAHNICESKLTALTGSKKPDLSV